MHKLTKSTTISAKVKKEVWQRDGHRCIACGSSNASPNAHVVSRAHGGLGVVKNIVTLCPECHRKFDNGKNSEYAEVANKIFAYVLHLYPNWTAETVTFNKYGGLK